MIYGRALRRGMRDYSLSVLNALGHLGRRGVCRAHPREYHESNIPRVRSKGRWDHEELLILARAECVFRQAGVRNINQRLVGITPDHTLESIKRTCQTLVASLPPEADSSQPQERITFNPDPVTLDDVREQHQPGPPDPNGPGRLRCGTPYTTSAFPMALTSIPSTLVIPHRRPGECSMLNMRGGCYLWLGQKGGDPGN